MSQRSRRDIIPIAIDAALAIADDVGWEQVRLHAVAGRSGLTLPEIGRVFRDVDAIANAWFGQARQALLAVTERELQGLAADERLALAFGRWLEHLAPHQAVARQILGYKLHPPHLHHWVPLVFDLSRLVHDLLDVARVAGDGRLRQMQEVGLTLIVLATLREWMRDRSPGQERSLQRLGRRLAYAGRLAERMARRRTGAAAGHGNTGQPSGPTSASA